MLDEEGIEQVADVSVLVQLHLEEAVEARQEEAQVSADLVDHDERREAASPGPLVELVQLVPVRRSAAQLDLDEEVRVQRVAGSVARVAS